MLELNHNAKAETINNIRHRLQKRRTLPSRRRPSGTSPYPLSLRHRRVGRSSLCIYRSLYRLLDERSAGADRQPERRRAGADAHLSQRPSRSTRRLPPGVMPGLMPLLSGLIPADGARGLSASGFSTVRASRDTDLRAPASPVAVTPQRHGRTRSGHPRLTASWCAPGGSRAVAPRGCPEQVRA